MSAFVAKYPTLVNELRTKVSVLPYLADSTNAIELTGLWDTGAQFSVITQRVADLLGLEPIDINKAYTANGWYETVVYRLDAIIWIPVANEKCIRRENRKVIAARNLTSAQRVPLNGVRSVF